MKVKPLTIQNKGLVLSVLALILLVGTPAAIAYADASDAELEERNPVVVDEFIKTFQISIKDTAASDYRMLTLPVDDYVTVDDSHVRLHYIYEGSPADVMITTYWTPEFVAALKSGDGFGIRVHEASGSNPMHIGFLKSGTYSSAYGFSTNDKTERIYSAVDRLYIEPMPGFVLRFTPDVSLGFVYFDLEFYTVSHDSVFTDEVIEGLLIASGALLIVCAIYATPWIQVGTLSKATRKAYAAGVRAGKRATGSVKTSVKKRTTKGGKKR